MVEDEPAPKELTETSFLVMAGLGMDAEIMLGVDDNLKKKVGWFAYFVSGIKALRFPTMRVHISVDGGLDPFDFCALVPVITGAGGCITDWEGRPLTLTSSGNLCVAAANGALHARVLEKLN